MSSVVLDASALLALLKGEPGGAKVASVVADAAISVINLSEVVSHFVRVGMPTRDVEDMLNALPFTLVRPMPAWLGRQDDCARLRLK